MTLLDSLQRRLAEGLQRKSATTCDRWAEQYIVLGKPVPGPLTFKYHPWSREWMNYNGDWTGMKAAQMAMTMAALARGLFTIDIRRNDVLYILPKRNPDATDFSKAKFDTLLELSPHLMSMFSNVKNVGHKQSGHVNFFLRGSRSKSALKSISVGLKIFDEFDEMYQPNVTLAQERSSGFLKEDKQTIKLSTPTVPDYGIAKEIENTTQEHFIFVCPHCDKYTEFFFPDDLVVTADSLSDEKGIHNSYVKCHECKTKIQEEEKFEILAKGIWTPTANKDSYTRGFLINQLYSMTVEPWEIAKLSLEAQTDPVKEQELYNSKGGLPHAVEGAQITVEQIRACIKTHSQRKSPPPLTGLITMGVDVGHKILYYWIDRWLLPENLGVDLNTYSTPVTIQEGTVPEFRYLDRLMREFQIKQTVVDVDPAFRDAIEFSGRFEGRVLLCRFVKGLRKSKVQVHTDESDKVIHVDRTYWLDISQNRFRNQKIILPIDVSEDVEKHISALIRYEAPDKNNNLIASWKSTRPDHKALARVYSEIALPLAVSGGEGQNIENFL